MSEPEYYYRIDGITYAPPADEYGDPGRGPGRSELITNKYLVLKHTPKGVWLKTGTHFDEGVWEKTREQIQVVEKRFVLYSARKRFACPTVELALVSFITRKKKQASIYRVRAAEADWFAELALKELNRLPPNEVNFT